ncbi:MULTISPECIES: acyl-CoA synthetase [Hydrocarboniphaga]|uniref:AMP-binding domain protein n=1 Tax=Hydrocarboniphaga effusa AP103 TaxID=1172194 RepID=I7ZFW4_9GAMM|nr:MULTISPECIES: acyl-CoA synthetase [Hydrocarboniphaga]EIT70587.1 AMP-binding domain protein [Hydrocarboniphaga effusa AP103]MDZ4081280.1 acyl-CoA synthetase [Hydrocarboniphaga sp.]
MPGIATIRDVERAEEAGLPVDLPQSTYAMLREGAKIDPDAPALSFFLTTEEHRRPETWTYRELLARITQTANFFNRLGVGKNDVVAFVLPNLPETHFVIWGGQAAGIVAAFNPLLEGPALAELINATNAKVLVTLAPFPNTDVWTKLAPVLPQLRSVRHLVLVNLADRVRGLRGLAARLLQKREAWRLHGRKGLRGAIPASISTHDFGSAIRRENGSELNSGRHIDGDDESSYFCTGGTTGLPKIAVRRHRNEVANAWSAGAFLGDGVGPGKVVFCGLPLFHVNGVLVTGLLPFSKGAHVILGTPQGYRGPGLIPRFWEIVERHRINFFSGVPTLYTALLQLPTQGRDLSSLEYGLCGAAPMPVEVFRNFQRHTGIKILEGYGLTEATCVSSVNPPLGDRRIGSIGLRVPGQPMKAVVLDDSGRYQRDAQVDEVGVLIVSGPNVFAGYRIAEQNKNLWLDTGDGQRWLNTGDLARQDADGYFWLTGRKKELIIRGGHNIDPLTIEEPLHRHPAVQIAAAVGRPDAHAGELPVAYVQLREGRSTSERELVDFLGREITERAAIPKQVRLIGQMPLTAVGKIYKPALKQLETRDAIESALRDAALAYRELELVEDKSKGLTLRLVLEPGASPDDARRVLGAFPFPFTIE